MLRLQVCRLFAIALLLMGMALVGAVLMGMNSEMSFAQDSQATPTPSPTPSPKDCAACHLDIAAAWQNSTHALAYENTVFQTAWQDTNRDADCLACHTTGFVPRTGEYEQTGVTCEACHGTPPINHPEEPMASKPDVSICADCHITTFSEWERSVHGEQAVDCTSCHSSHPQQLKFETVDALCMNCHQEVTSNYAHETHPKNTCSSCHWYQSIEDSEHILTGNLKPTGHDNVIETFTCVDCHTDLHPELFEPLADAEFMNAEQPLQEAQVEISELEAEVQNVKTEGENAIAIRIIQGLVFGAILGGASVFGIHQFRAARRRKNS